MMKADNPTYISYRENGSAQFVEVERLLESGDYDRIWQVYKSVEQNVNAYDPSHAETLLRLNQRFYGKIRQMHTVSHWGRALSGLKLHTAIARSRKLGRRYGAIKTHAEQLRAGAEPKRQRDSTPPPEVSAMRAQRLDDPQAELARLEAEQLGRFEDNPFFTKEWNTLTESQAIAVAHSFELQAALRETHYVFNHGQAQHLMLLNTVARALKERHESSSYAGTEVLRHDVDLAHIPREANVDWFKQRLAEHPEGDHAFRRELICGDANLANVDRDESALHFFSTGTNVVSGEDFRSGILERMLKEYFPNPETRERLIGDLLQLGPKEGGNLYSICVPKERFGEIGYFARPYGKPFSPAVEDRYQREADGIQDGEVLEAPQVRLLTHMLTPENGVRIFLNSTLSDEEIAHFESQVNLLVQRAQTQFLI